MTDGCISQQLQGWIVLNVIMFDDSAMTLGSVLAQADVGYEEKVTDILSNSAGCILTDAVLVISIRPDIVLFRREAEQENTADARPLGLSGQRYCIVDRQIVLARHGAYFRSDPFADTDKNRVNHGLRRDSRFANQVAELLGAP